MTDYVQNLDAAALLTVETVSLFGPYPVFYC